MDISKLLNKIESTGRGNRGLFLGDLARAAGWSISTLYNRLKEPGLGTVQQWAAVANAAGMTIRMDQGVMVMEDLETVAA